MGAALRMISWRVCSPLRISQPPPTRCATKWSLIALYQILDETKRSLVASKKPGTLCALLKQEEKMKNRANPFALAAVLAAGKCARHCGAMSSPPGCPGYRLSGQGVTRRFVVSRDWAVSSDACTSCDQFAIGM